MDDNQNGDKGPPDPEHRERPERRLFTAEFKRRVVRETENLQPGEVAAYLRRFGVFHAQVRLWQEQLERGQLAALSPKRPGRKPRVADPRAKELAEKQREMQRLRERLAQAEAIIQVQKRSPRCSRFRCIRQTAKTTAD